MLLLRPIILKIDEMMIIDMEYFVWNDKEKLNTNVQNKKKKILSGDIMIELQIDQLFFLYIRKYIKTKKMIPFSGTHFFLFFKFVIKRKSLFLIKKSSSPKHLHFWNSFVTIHCHVYSKNYIKSNYILYEL